MDPVTHSSMPGSVAAVETSTSAVSWGAIFAGAFTIVAASLILLAIGTALGFSTMSPWSGHGASAATLTAMTAVWLIIVQWLSSALGGYISGRLRTKWTGVHTDEVFFRDTAHGMLAWAVSAVIGTIILSGAVTSAIGLGAQAGATVASGAAQGASAGLAANAQRSYQVDTLFRPNQSPNGGGGAQPQSNPRDQNAEAGRILAVSAAQGNISNADKAYLAQMIASRTGISTDDAQKRIDAVVAQEKATADKARQVADATRKAAAATALYVGLSMLVGAFIAAVSGAIGGRLRDLP
ncbi:MAG TPA: hypothetical protein VL574_09455 [Stellaceae bacterium]|nr:hypothetical protein [Stellaceae bacterium]